MECIGDKDEEEDEEPWFDSGRAEKEKMVPEAEGSKASTAT